MKSPFLFALITIIFNSEISSQSIIQSGPMLGYANYRESAIWIQTTKEATVKIKYWPTNKPENVSLTNTVKTNKATAFTALLIADNIAPGNTYAYNILINDQIINVPQKTEFTIQELWKWRNDPPDFSFSTGSCAYINETEYDRPGIPYGSDYEIFETIHKYSPNFMIWLGDNTYLREPDWNSKTGILKRWTHTRSVSEMQNLLASTHHYAIWDDHDYGPNNSDRSFWNKSNSLEAFKMFWANPSYGIGDIKGVITQFQWYDIDFFLLDNRFYRSPNNLNSPNKTILGEKQKQWLKDAMVSAEGSFKVIAMGGQFLNNSSANHEIYSSNGFINERQEIIDFIYQHNIKNVVFITGDRHHSELCILKEKGKPRIIDLTVSALTSGAGNNEDEPNTLRVQGTYTNQHNFGLVSFKKPLKEREIHIQIVDNNGKLIWKKKYSAE